MRYLLFCLLVLNGLEISCSGKWYTYEVPVLVGGQPSRLLSFERTGAAAEGTVTLQCRVIDLDDQQPMSSTVVIFTKTEERTTLAGITDENGFFEKTLPPGAYDFEVRYTGKNSFRQASNVLESGGLYVVSIGLGSSGTPSTRVVKSRRPLKPEEARRRAAGR